MWRMYYISPTNAVEAFSARDVLFPFTEVANCTSPDEPSLLHRVNVFFQEGALATNTNIQLLFAKSALSIGASGAAAGLDWSTEMPSVIGSLGYFVPTLARFGSSATLLPSMYSSGTQAQVGSASQPNLGFPFRQPMILDTGSTSVWVAGVCVTGWTPTVADNYVVGLGIEHRYKRTWNSSQR